MKKILTILGLAVLLALPAAGQVLRGQVTTTAYTRQLLTNSTSALWRSALGVGIDGTNSISFDTGQFTLDANTVHIADGTVITNPVLAISANSNLWVTGAYGGNLKVTLPTALSGNSTAYLYSDRTKNGNAAFLASATNGAASFGWQNYDGSGTLYEWAMVLNNDNSMTIQGDYAAITMLDGLMTLKTNVAIPGAIAVTGLITNSALNASRALVSGANKEITNSTVLASELAALSGITTNVQLQLSQRIEATNSTATGLTLAGNTTNASGGVIYGAVLASGSVATNPVVEGWQLIKNSTAPTAAPTNAAWVFAEGGEWKYLTSAASEGTEATNRVHNRAAQVVAAGTGTALNGSFAAITFTSTAPEVALPTAGTYLVNANLVVTNCTAADTVLARLYNGTDNTEIAGSTNVVTAFNTNNVGVSVSAIVSVTGSKTVRLEGVNTTGNRGTPMAAYTKIEYVRLY